MVDNNGNAMALHTGIYQHIQRSHDRVNLQYCKQNILQLKTLTRNHDLKSKTFMTLSQMNFWVGGTRCMNALYIYSLEPLLILRIRSTEMRRFLGM